MNERFGLQFIEFKNYNSILVKNDTEIWAGSKSGFHILTFKNAVSLNIESEQTYTKKNTNRELGSDFVTQIYKDRQGIVWIGTLGGGICKLINDTGKFKLYHDDLKSENLKNNTINCFFEDSKNNLWIGTDKTGIIFFESGITDYNFKFKDILDVSKPTHDVIGFYEVELDETPYIIASTNYPLNVQVYDTSGEKIECNTTFIKVLKDIKYPISSIVKDDNLICIGTTEGGLIRYNIKEESFKRFLTNNTKTLTSNLILSLSKDSNNDLWIGTNKGLLFLKHSEKNNGQPKFKVYNYNKTDDKSISYDYVLPIIETNDNKTWIGTLGGGLNKYDSKTDSFTRLTTDNRLSNNSIKAIVEDIEHQLWVSTNSGISRINPKTLEILNFSVSDGLQDYEFGEMCAIKRSDGELLFGGNNGFNSIYPKDIEVTVPVNNALDPNKEYRWVIYFLPKGGTWVNQYDPILMAFSVLDALSIEDVENENNIKVYPTVFSNEISIESKFNITNIELFNLSGVSILKKKFNQKLKVSITPKNLQSGIYLLRTELSDGKSVVHKVVKF